MENILDLVKEKWKMLTAFSKKELIKEQLWEEIVYLYSAQHRHYHNLSHIGHLFTLCDKYIDRIKSPAVVGFAIIYHDIVYDTYRQDNEEQSAKLAEIHLKQLSLNASIIENVKQFIVATKNHEVPADYPLSNDLALFLDFDMAILASAPEFYSTYSDNIRLEYSKYGDDIYKEGRKLALKRVLSSDHIFASEEFRVTMEEPARKNIQEEIDSL